MSEPTEALLIFFVVASGLKWNKSELKKNNEKYIDGPAKYEKGMINSYAIVSYRYELPMIKKYADKFNIKIYDGFINSSNSKTIKYGYHIDHFHMLCKKHQISSRNIPQRWSNVKKQPLKNIIHKIIIENPQIQLYQQQYNLTIKLSSIYQDNLILIKNNRKQFEFRSLLRIIPLGNEEKIKTIFANHEQKNKISSMLNQNIKYNSKLLTMNKRRKKKKMKFRGQNTEFINTFIEQANQKISHKADELQISLFSLKQTDSWYKYVAGYAYNKWGIPWNDFVENKRYKYRKIFQCIDDKKTLDEVTQIFNDEENRKS